MSRKKWLCLDCNLDTGKAGEHYFIRDEVWHRTGLDKIGMLCVECAETRIGRVLVAADFTDCYLNTSAKFHRSTRLIDRMNKCGLLLTA